jgi:hypothetical protein
MLRFVQEQTMFLSYINWRSSDVIAYSPWNIVFLWQHFSKYAEGKKIIILAEA